MDNKQIEIDQSSRKSIRENINENYFVEAGAGSGKTTILVDRMVKMIEEDIDISLISAITFTKAAANEFYERFQKKLIEKSLENNEYKDKYLRALQNIDLAFMGTIDAFCNMIMSEHPTEGLIPSNSKVIDYDSAQDIYKREYANIQNGFYNDSSLEEKGKEFLRYDDYPEETFILTLNSLLNHRDCEVIIPKVSKVDLDVKYQDSQKTIRKIVNSLCEHPEFIISSNDDKAEKVRKAFKRHKNTFNNNWDNNIPDILKAFKDTFIHKDFRLLPANELEAILQEGIDYFEPYSGKGKWLVINPDRIPKLVEEIEEIKYSIILDFVDSAKDKILEKLRKEGSLTFNDYLVYLRDTLRKDAKNGGKLIKHISSRHKYFLIDEFQDTDPIQAEIFFFLAAQDIKENWRDCIPHKGSLFIVGDPKQSIYRFKNADVASYLNVEKMFKQPVGEVLYLYQNFRSTYEVKDWFNKTFKEILKDGDEQAEFKEIPNDEKDILDGFSGVYKYEVPSKPKTDEEKDEVKVKNLILKLYDNPNFQISEEKKNCKDRREIIKRKLDFKDFMVITPSKPALAKYTKVFREFGIPYYVEGNIVFKESKAFELFVEFFGSIINPNDNRYLYSVLKSNLFNISDKELNEAKSNGLDLRILSDVDEINISDNLRNALNKINEFAKDAKVLCPSSLFKKIIENIEGFKKQGTENMEYVFFALELLKSKEASKEIITNKDALTFFEKLLYEKNNQERCPGLKKDGNQVHLANLHKVKGLEAPVVILAYTMKKKRNADFRITREDTGNKGYLFEVTKQLDNGASLSILSTKKYDETLKLDEEASSEAEKLRLEYVAATRARNVLIIGSAMTQKGLSESNHWYDILTTDSSFKLNDIDLVLNKEVPKVLNVNPVKYDDIKVPNSIINDNYKALEESNYKLTNPSKLSHQTEYEEINSKLQKQVDENNGDSLATITGTMVHRLMELIVISKDSINKKDIVKSILLENLSLEFKDKEEHFNNILNNIYDVIHNGGYEQKGKAPKDILKEIKEAEEVYSEVPFTYLDENNQLMNGIIDLVYVKDDKIHIVDYKTNKFDSNLDELYKNQLEAYKEAIKQTLNKEVEDSLIYHIEIK